VKELFEGRTVRNVVDLPTGLSIYFEGDDNLVLTYNKQSHLLSYHVDETVEVPKLVRRTYYP
jgi:hypothetical protein